uniref:Uncharacterized protein n=1 Tax=Arundo donax TaxID=35708 RepID=A0A0A9F0Z7_ARUDO
MQPKPSLDTCLKALGAELHMLSLSSPFLFFSWIESTAPLPWHGRLTCVYVYQLSLRSSLG